MSKPSMSAFASLLNSSGGLLVITKSNSVQQSRKKSEQCHKRAHTDHLVCFLFAFAGVGSVHNASARELSEHLKLHGEEIDAAKRTQFDLLTRVNKEQSAPRVPRAL